jgi:hypothetical protein
VVLLDWLLLLLLLALALLHLLQPVLPKPS